MQKIKQQHLVTKIEVLGGKCFIYRNSRSGDVWQYCQWLKSEKKYLRQSLKTIDRHVAIEYAEKRYADTLGRVYSGEKIFSLTAKELYDCYIKHIEKRCEFGEIKKTSVATIRTHLRHYLAFVGAETKITSIKSEQFREFKQWRQQHSTVTLISIRDTQMHIAALYKWAIEEEEILQHRFKAKFKKIVVPKNEGKRSGMTYAQFQQIISVSKAWHKKSTSESDLYERKQLHNFIVVQSQTGMRTCETLGLQWRDIKINNDGQAEISIREETTKRGKSRSILMRYGDTFERIESHSKFKEKNDHVFSSFTAGKKWRKLSFYERWQELIRAVKEKYETFDTRKSLYDLRHWYISSHLLAGHSAWLIAKHCGTSAVMIMKTYDNVTSLQVGKRILSKKLKYIGDDVIFKKDEVRKDGDEWSSE